MEAIEKRRSEKFIHISPVKKTKNEVSYVAIKLAINYARCGHLWVTDEIVFLIIIMFKVKVTSYSYTIITCREELIKP